MIRVELHAHTSDDQEDLLPHSARDLILRVAALGYGGLAITLHDTVWDPAPLAVFAREHGVRLIPGIERTIEGCHVLILNAPAAAMLAVRRFEDLAPLKAVHPHALIVAPHACFPIGTAVGRRRLDASRPVWDAIEVNAMHVAGVDWNRDAIEWATTNGVPMVGNGDVHRLTQLGRTWSEVDVDIPADLSDAAAADAICDAIRAGQVRVVSRRLSHGYAVFVFAQMLIGGVLGRLRRLAMPSAG
jgi:predicted metal-dependent phosphoesterase TrpH